MPKVEVDQDKLEQVDVKKVEKVQAMARGHLEMVAAWVPAGCARDTRGACPGWLRAAIARLAFPFYGHGTPPLTA